MKTKTETKADFAWFVLSEGVKHLDKQLILSAYEVLEGVDFNSGDYPKDTWHKLIDKANNIISQTNHGMIFRCKECAKNHLKAMYAMAQNAMGHEIIFTCECGHKTKLN